MTRFVPPPAAQMVDRFEELAKVERKMRRTDLIMLITSLVAIGSTGCWAVAIEDGIWAAFFTGMAVVNAFTFGWAMASKKFRRQAFEQVAARIEYLRRQ